MREQNLAQSISGLTAMAMNEGTNDEGVWVSVANPDYTGYYNSLVRRLKARQLGTFSVWDLVDRYKGKGIINGYILYDYASQDNSINMATAYASAKKGLLIDVRQEAQAKAKGLIKLFDARGKKFDRQTFSELKGMLNPNLLVVANPRFFNNRDYAIAHKSMIYYGVDSLYNEILDWVKPLSPVVGWNSGDEFKQIEVCTRRGLINEPADWCVNLPLLTVPASSEPLKVKSLNPKDINWKAPENYHAFVMSDGDNLQWTFGSFLSSKDYWSSPYNAEIPMSFTSCVVNLSVAARDVYDQLLKSQPDNVSVVEYGGGYYYPDLFAKATPEPEKLLRQCAAMINVQMKKTGTKVFGFICKNVSSKASMEAYKIYAEEIEDLTGMIAVQYAPYNGGHGQTFWVKNKKGIEIPVVTAKYQLWANQKGKGSGNSKKIAELINLDHASTKDQSKQLSWTIVHAWSEYDINHEDIPDKARKAQNGVRGVMPVKWTKELLQKDTRVISIEELLWRMRMQHNSEDTRKQFHR